MRWLAAAGVVLLALVLTLGTAGLPREVGSERELAAVDFGFPVSFVEADMRVLSPPRYPQVVSWNPWEDPADFHESRFAASFALVLTGTALAAVGALALVRRIG